MKRKPIQILETPPKFGRTVPLEEVGEYIKSNKIRRRNESRAIADNAIRWCTNILVEVNANHVGPNFLATREELMEIISRLNAVQRTLYKEKVE